MAQTLFDANVLGARVVNTILSGLPVWLRPWLWAVRDTGCTMMLTSRTTESNTGISAWHRSALNHSFEIAVYPRGRLLKHTRFKYPVAEMCPSNTLSIDPTQNALSDPKRQTWTETHRPQNAMHALVSSAPSLGAVHLSALHYSFAFGCPALDSSDTTATTTTISSTLPPRQFS